MTGFYGYRLIDYDRFIYALPETNITLETDGWKTNFLSGAMAVSFGLRVALFWRNWCGRTDWMYNGWALKRTKKKHLKLYCWWKKSCTSWYGKYPIIYRVLYIPGDAGFLPSTVPRAFFVEEICHTNYPWFFCLGRSWNLTRENTGSLVFEGCRGWR